MDIRTPADFGALIRDRRQRAGLDQATLAGRAGVSRQWIVSVERGKATAPLVLVLRTLEVLGVRLVADASADQRPRRRPGRGARRVETVDIDEIVRRARERR